MITQKLDSFENKKDMEKKNKIRIVTAASLFDGHDVAINIMRRIMQAQGAEVIHLGHNRSAQEIVEAAIQEDADAIAITSYQGGHIEFFKYMFDLLAQNDCKHIKIFGGGGGTILLSEIEELEAYGIAKIYSPDDGRHLGLEGMIAEVLAAVSKEEKAKDVAVNTANFNTQNWKAVAQAISIAEAGEFGKIQQEIDKLKGKTNSVILGITGTGGAGKSSVTDEIVRRFLRNFEDKSVAVISVDPSKKKSGGALLGDRIRMNAIFNKRAYMRSMATRESDRALSEYIKPALDVCKAAGFEFIILESAGVGQSDASILEFCDVSLYVMTPEYGAASQLEKINMLDYADVIAINKFDKLGADDAYNDVCKQYKRNHVQFQAKNEELPIVGTVASKFNNNGVNALFRLLLKTINTKLNVDFGELHPTTLSGDVTEPIIPPARTRYLAEISETIVRYDNWASEQSKIASKLYQINGVLNLVNGE